MTFGFEMFVLHLNQNFFSIHRTSDESFSFAVRLTKKSLPKLQVTIGILKPPIIDILLPCLHSDKHLMNDQYNSETSQDKISFIEEVKYQTFRVTLVLLASSS